MGVLQALAHIIGSYDWLDFSLGSDSWYSLEVYFMTSTDSVSANGSGRKPAHYNGCFSIRPSTGIMNTSRSHWSIRVRTTLLKSAPETDTNSFFQEVRHACVLWKRYIEVF